MYSILRKFLFLFDAESIHYFTMNFLKSCCGISPLKKLISRIFHTPRQTVNVFGLTFKNPVGLAAGFDKNAKYLDALSCLGFGFIEIGTVTPLPQPGNPKPRLFRLKKDGAIINRMGFNNDGAAAIALRLKQFRTKKNDLVIGGNIGKNKTTPNELAWQDYEKCFGSLYPWVDYFVVNVSSPNTPGLRDLQHKDALRKILTHLQDLRRGESVYKPILLKIAPDLNTEDVKEICGLALEINLDGLVVNNTTIERTSLLSSEAKIRSIGNGGLSGKPLLTRSTRLLSEITDLTHGGIPIIGSGGIFTKTDALRKLNAGASLVQVFTGFIYEGPMIVKHIVKGIRDEHL